MAGLPRYKWSCGEPVPGLQSGQLEELGATQKAPPVLAPENRPWFSASEVFMAEFIRRLFSTHNLYCMGVCGVFLFVWFYLSREQHSAALDPLAHRRPRRPGSPLDHSS